MNNRGAVLVYVLIATVISAIICTTILSTRLQPALTAANAVLRVQNDVSAQAALNRVQQVWMAGGSCASDSSAGVSCSGTGCNCTCAVAGLGTVIALPTSGGACSLTVTSP
jgi:Tfp pilus assembly protein PilX